MVFGSRMGQRIGRKAEGTSLAFPTLNHRVAFLRGVYIGRDCRPLGANIGQYSSPLPSRSRKVAQAGIRKETAVKVNRTVDNDPNQGVRTFVSAHSDEYFIELCALSTTDALTMEELRQLELHLSICASCREIKAQYDAVVTTTLPAMAADHTETGDNPSHE